MTIMIITEKKLKKLSAQIQLALFIRQVHKDYQKVLFKPWGHIK